MPAATIVDYGGLAGQPLYATGKAPKKLVFGTWSPGTYATSGVAITGVDKALSKLDGILFVAVPLYDLVYNTSTKLVLAYVKSTGAEVAAAFDLSAVTAQFIAFGDR